MTEEKTEGIPRENQEKTPKLERVAVCLNCTNEWISRKGNAKKPAKCPICGSKRCAWKDEVTPKAEELPAGVEEKPVFSGENEGETRGIPMGNDGEKGENEGKTYDLPDDPGISPETVDIPLSEEPGNTIPGKLNTDPEELPTMGGFPLVLGLIVLVLLGTLAGVGWFLGRRPKRRQAPLRADTPVQMNMRFTEVA